MVSTCPVNLGKFDHRQYRICHIALARISHIALAEILEIKYNYIILYIIPLFQEWGFNHDVVFNERNI